MPISTDISPSPTLKVETYIFASCYTPAPTAASAAPLTRDELPEEQHTAHGASLVPADPVGNSEFAVAFVCGIAVQDAIVPGSAVRHVPVEDLR